MKYTASILGGIAASLFLQQCPAPLIATPIAALATGFTAGGGVAIGGAVAATSGGGGGGGQARKRELAQVIARGSSNTSSKLLQNCIADMFTSDSVSAKVDSGSMEVRNTPRSCIDAVDEYNEDPEIENLNALYGSIQCDGSSINLKNVPDFMFQGNPQVLIDRLEKEVDAAKPSGYEDQDGDQYGDQQRRGVFQSAPSRHAARLAM